MAELQIVWVQTDDAIDDMTSDGVDLTLEVFHPNAWSAVEMANENRDLHRKFRLRVLGHLEDSVPLQVELMEIDVDSDELTTLYEKHYGVRD